MHEWLRPCASVAMALSVLMIFTGLVRCFIRDPKLPKKRKLFPGPGTSVVIGSVLFVVSMMILSGVK